MCFFLYNIFLRWDNFEHILLTLHEVSEEIAICINADSCRIVHIEMIEASEALKARIGDVLTPKMDLSGTFYHVNLNATQNYSKRVTVFIKE